MDSRHVLVCPIDWGLGHATRCIPVISMLVDHGHRVSIASSGEALLLLRQEFPEIIFHSLTPYQPRYPKGGAMVVTMAMQSLRIANVIRTEHLELERIVSQNEVDFVISDNRFGCWSAQVPSVMMTHQIHLILPAWISGLADAVQHRYLKKFEAVWVPDFPGEDSITHVFTRATALPVHFMGPLSRLKRIDGTQKEYDLLVLLSGPEPQRSVFESKVRDQCQGLKKKMLIVRGQPAGAPRVNRTNLTEADHLSAKELNEVIVKSEIILSRSGYSTVMDLAATGSRAIFVPTPGQTEQEYIARELTARKIAYSETQKEFDLCRAIERSSDFTGFQFTEPGAHLETLFSQYDL